ncbi:ATP-binding protein [Vibrio owensii]|uniref:ATP-binding protein n=1 Tax=Vibrio owensii TaxID=696485 RepID=UPI0006CFFB0B|nr:ATP-binding protein [Vibrio owensii]
MSTKPMSVSTGVGAIWSRLQQLNPNIVPIPKYEDAVAQIEQSTRQAELEQSRQHESYRAEYRKRSALGGSYIPEKYQHCTLDNYQVYAGERQASAVSFARNWVNDFKNLNYPKGFVFTGDTGTGKNHLAAAMCLEVINAGGEAKLVSVNNLDLHRRDACFGDGAVMSERKFIDALTKVDLFILDEIGISSNSASQMVFIDQLIHSRSDHGLPTGIISNMPPEALANHLGMRTMDRISEGSGSMISFGWDSFRTRAAR